MEAMSVIKNEEEGEEEEEHFSPVVMGSAIFGIVSLLILVTIAFEAIQDRFVHHSPKYMRPMVKICHIYCKLQFVYERTSSNVRWHLCFEK